MLLSITSTFIFFLNVCLWVYEDLLKWDAPLYSSPARGGLWRSPPGYMNIRHRASKRGSVTSCCAKLFWGVHPWCSSLVFRCSSLCLGVLGVLGPALGIGGPAQRIDSLRPARRITRTYSDYPNRPAWLFIHSFFNILAECIFSDFWSPSAPKMTPKTLPKSSPNRSQQLSSKRFEKHIEKIIKWQTSALQKCGFRMGGGAQINV